MDELIINGNTVSLENLKIDFTNREIQIMNNNISFNSCIFLRNIIKTNISRVVYLKNKNQKIYTFYDCYLGKYNGNMTSIKFNAFIIDYFIEDIKKYKVDKIEVELEYKNINLVDIEESIGKSLRFSIGKMNYCMELVFKERYYKITLSNNNKLTTEKFIHYFLLFYEFLILNLGYFLGIKKIIMSDGDRCFKYSYPFSSKYDGSNNYNSYSCVLGKINMPNIKQIYKNWLRVRKNTHIIYDIYMNLCSVKYFVEIALSTITNCMEGYYKCIHKQTMKKPIQTKNGIKNVDKDFKDIMKEYLNSTEGKIIISSTDRKRLKIYKKLTNHRNFFAHLDKRKNRFYGESNLYMLLKIKLLFRVFILKDINQSIEINNLANTIRRIEQEIEWNKGE